MNNFSPGGFLVVWRKYYLENAARQKDPAPCALPMSEQEVFERYRGIDGLPWPDKTPMLPKLRAGLASPSDLAIILDYYTSLPSKEFSDLLFVSELDVAPSSAFSFWGYDYGNYITEYNYYSVILHEIIFGRYRELQDFSKVLNSNLLLPSRDFGSAIEECRSTLLGESADLERQSSDEPFGLIAVYGYDGPN